jgi:hypothetical protein
MKHRWAMSLVAANVLALLGLVFVYPDLMVSPGALVPPHSELAKDCFACHAPWRGTSAARCETCHALPDIGRRTTKGLPLAPPRAMTSFHQELIAPDCVSCHDDHEGPKLTKGPRKPFSHALLRPETRDRCEACHAAPGNEIHREIGVSCGKCHAPERWKPATFEHALLANTALARCEGCHKAPSDSSHPKVSSQCQQCHTIERWKPASFDHGQFFQLDRHHDVACATCHEGNDYKRYSCYGCHEHTPAKVRAEHAEEGISSFENCVQCHRSPGGKPEKHRSGRRNEHDD